ncbi:uncharacterized protein [Dendrobates tinctorius]|uniref:uncharacterized protein n=1 Tax=Dendrobates tinctorius TaxID=92724 RepID=UPI003CC9EBCF
MDLVQYFPKYRMDMRVIRVKRMMFFWKMLLLCSYAILSHNAVFARPAAKKPFAMDLMSTHAWSPGKSLNHGTGGPHSSWSKSGGSHSWTDSGTKEIHGKKSAMSKPAWNVDSGGKDYLSYRVVGSGELAGSGNTWGSDFDSGASQATVNSNPMESLHGNDLEFVTTGRESDINRASVPFSVESRKKGGFSDLLGGNKHHSKHTNKNSEHVASGNYVGDLAEERTGSESDRMSNNLQVNELLGSKGLHNMNGVKMEKIFYGFGGVVDGALGSVDSTLGGVVDGALGGALGSVSGVVDVALGGALSSVSGVVDGALGGALGSVSGVVDGALGGALSSVSGVVGGALENLKLRLSDRLRYD